MQGQSRELLSHYDIDPTNRRLSLDKTSLLCGNVIVRQQFATFSRAQASTCDNTLMPVAASIGRSIGH